MNWLDFVSIFKSFPGVEALRDVSFVVAPGEFVSIIGPTNAGKSTLLKIVAGLFQPSAGKVFLDGGDATGLQPRDRKVSLLFQNIALFPNLTGFDNIAYPLRLNAIPETKVATRVERIAAIVNVAHLLGRLPRTFSGGEQQRVAIGRALAQRTRLLMLDEPLTNLDARLRIALRHEFRTLRDDEGQTVVYVTHDQVEAMSLSDRIVVLNKGRVEQIGTPDQIYHRPATRFVAEFIGTPPMNVIDVELGGHGLVLAGSTFSVPMVPRMNAVGRLPAKLALGIRPEDITASQETGKTTPLSGEVIWVERFGNRNVLDIRIARHRAKVAVRADHPVNRPGPAWFGFAADRCELVDCDSDRFLRPEG